MGNLIGIALNLQIALGSMAILTIFFQSKSMGYFSISLNHLQLPLLMFYSSQCINLSPPWSGLLTLFLIQALVKKHFFQINQNLFWEKNQPEHPSFPQLRGSLINSLFLGVGRGEGGGWGRGGVGGLGLPTGRVDKQFLHSRLKSSSSGAKAGKRSLSLLSIIFSMRSKIIQ